MVRLITQPAEPATPRIDPSAGARQADSRSASTLARGLTSLAGSVFESRQPNMAQENALLAAGKDRAVAEMTVGQIDSALATMVEAGGLSVQDVTELKDVDRLNAKLDQLRLQKPASTFDSIRRIAKLRQSIAQNPLAAPELLTAFGQSNNGSLGAELETLFNDVDARETARRKAIEAHRLEIGPEAADWTDAQVEYSLQSQINHVRRSEYAERQRQILQDEFRIANINEFNLRDITVARNETTSARLARQALLESERLLRSEEHPLAIKTASNMLNDAVRGYNRNAPDAAEYADNVTFEFEQRINDLRQEYREKLGPSASEAELDRLMYPFESMLETWNQYAQGTVGASAVQQARARIENGAAVNLYQRFPQLPRVRATMEAFTELFPETWLTQFKIDQTLEPLMGPLLQEIGRPVAEAVERVPTGGDGPGVNNLLDAGATMGMTRDQAMSALKNYSKFLRNGLNSAQHTPEQKAELHNIVRATLRSPNNTLFSGFFSSGVDVEAMNALLPLMADPQTLAIINEDPDLADQLTSNFEPYIGELSQSIADDISQILGTKINVERIPDILGLRSDVPTAAEFVDIRIGGTNVVELITELGYRTEVRENGTVVITPRTNRELKLRDPNQLKLLRSLDRYLATWRETYGDKIKYASQFLAANSELSPRQIAEEMLAGRNPLDIPVNPDVEDLTQVNF